MGPGYRSSVVRPRGQGRYREPVHTAQTANERVRRHGSASATPVTVRPVEPDTTGAGRGTRWRAGGFPDGEAGAEVRATWPYGRPGGRSAVTGAGPHSTEVDVVAGDQPLQGTHGHQWNRHPGPRQLSADRAPLRVGPARGRTRGRPPRAPSAVVGVAARGGCRAAGLWPVELLGCRAAGHPAPRDRPAGHGAEPPGGRSEPVRGPVGERCLDAVRKRVP